MDLVRAHRYSMHQQLQLLEAIRQGKQQHPDTSPTLLEVVRTFNFVARTG